MNEYDLSRAFKRIENELIDSMMRNLERHKAEETEYGFNWEQWQALQLKELERYRIKNRKLFTGRFTDLNKQIETLYRTTCQNAQTEQEKFILEQIKKKDFTPTQTKDTQFFNVNDDKLNILIERTKADFTKAEYAVLRKADDVYRQTIFDAQVYANTTNDYNKAVDMATHDFLMKGLQSIQYKNGARHNIEEYARMAIRTGNKRAYLMGEGNARDEYGIHTVRVNKRTQACPKCVGFLGKVLVDDVYSGGTAKEAEQAGVPTLSQAIAQGFLHPNCKDIYSTYLDGVSKPATPWTKEEIEEIVGDYNQEQEINHAEDMRDSYARMAKYALSPDNKTKYQARADQWDTRINELKTTPPKPVEPPVVNVASQATSPAPVATIIEEKAFVPAKTIEEAETYAESLGLEATYKGVELEIANAMNESFKRGLDFCPSIKRRMRMVGSGQERNKAMKKALVDYYLNNSTSLQNAMALGYTDKQIQELAKKWAGKAVGRVGSDVWAFASDTTVAGIKEIEQFSGIFVNNKYANYAQMVKDAEENVRIKYHPVGTASVKAIFDHEMGHQLDYALGLRNHPDIVKLYRSMNKTEIKDNLSEYANENIKEFIAEAYSEYLNNPQPRDIARQVGEIIERLASEQR